MGRTLRFAVARSLNHVEVPDGASAIKFEDPRHGFMMAAPPRKSRAARENRNVMPASIAAE